MLETVASPIENDNEAGDDAAEVAERCVGSLDLRVFAIAPRASTVLSPFAQGLALWERGRPVQSPYLQAHPQHVAVVGLMRNESLRPRPGDHSTSRPSSVPRALYGDREKAMTVRAFAATI
jgi:hypothetical protein